LEVGGDILGRVFRRIPTPPTDRLLVLAAAAGLGLLGCLPSARGAGSPVALLGWLALVAPSLGALVGRTRIALFPFALAAPATWGLAFAVAQAGAARPLATGLWALCAVAGLFAMGHAMGRRSRELLGGAGAWLFLSLALAALPVGAGLLAGGAELARSHPAVARGLLDLSPLVLVFDCAGFDWTHAQDEVYRRAGIEWFQRRSFAGSLAGPSMLVVGCLLALLVPARSEP
jgi:hypothetical protein